MRAGVDITKTNNSALGLRPRISYARRPVRLQGEPHGARWYLADQLIEQDLGLDATLASNPLLAQPEFFLEPAHHPEAPVNHHLRAIRPRNSRWVRRQTRNRLNITTVRGVDGGGGAITHAGDVRRVAARAQNFTGLIRGCSKHRQTGRKT